MGPTNKVKYGHSKRDIITQTSDCENEESDRHYGTNLSAMERDIMLCTNELPEKLVLLIGTNKLEDNDLKTLMQLVKTEGNKILGNNQSLNIKRVAENLFIGKSSLITLSQFVNQKDRLLLQGFG